MVLAGLLDDRKSSVESQESGGLSPPLRSEAFFPFLFIISCFSNAPGSSFLQTYIFSYNATLGSPRCALDILAWAGQQDLGH